MPLPITCSCGALLEIDDRFIGRQITCPDCHRSLNTKPALPEPTSTSGLAVASFLLATVGAFTIIGSALGVAWGALALKRIRQAPEPIGGKRFAQVGVVLGGFFTLVTAVFLIAPDLVRVDGWLRAIEWAGKIDYNLDDVIAVGPRDGLQVSRSATIQRPSTGWAQCTHRKPDSQDDYLLLVNPWEDAYIVCLPDQDAAADQWKQVGKKRFLDCELVRGILGPANADSPQAKERDVKNPNNPDMQELILDFRAGSTERTFLVRVVRNGSRFSVVAAGTRTSRFARLQPVFAKVLESYKLTNEN